jgi:hypothetical protein
VVVRLEREVEELKHSVMERDELLEHMRDKLATAEAELKRYHPPLVRATFCIDMDNPIAEWLVLECLEPKVLAATVRRENQMRLSWLAKCIVLEADNTRLRALLREALEAAWLDDEWWGNEIPDEWFVRVKAALEGKS